tara:strand:+ start:397 stop:561 length:165 start_codon:yes stop_codon:yes gene_type:complete
MAQLYTIEEQTTTGWHKLEQKYRHLTKQECLSKYKLFVQDGINPDDLRVVRDDL